MGPGEGGGSIGKGRGALCSVTLTAGLGVASSYRPVADQSTINFTALCPFLLPRQLHPLPALPCPALPSALSRLRQSALAHWLVGSEHVLSLRLEELIPLPAARRQ